MVGERYDEAAWFLATESFWGVASYKKTVQWLPWWTTNRTIRASYNESIRLMLIKQKNMLKAGSTKKEIAEQMVSMRNKTKATERVKMNPKDVASIEKRNLNKYGDKLGPSVEYLIKQGKTYDEIIESSTRSNFWYNLFFLVF